MRHLKFTIIAAVVILVAGSCAKDVGEDANQVQRKLLGAWIRVNYGNVTPTSSGIYILDRDYGTGKAVTDTSYVFLDYTVQKLSGDFSDYTTADMARLMGTYSDTAHYSPVIWRRGVYNIYDGLDELLVGMKQGGHVKAAIPPDLMIITYPEELKKQYASIASDAQAATENLIYDITVKDVVEDIAAYENNVLEQFAKTYYPGLDTLSKGFYFKKIVELPDADTVSYDTNVKVRYVGKLLNGYCFDTNIQDTAKFYRRAGIERSALSVTFKETEDSFVSENSIIRGFAKTIRKMRYGEKAVAFFSSSLGYESKGSTNIPAYSPLFFEVWIEPKN